MYSVRCPPSKRFQKFSNVLKAWLAWTMRSTGHFETKLENNLALKNHKESLGLTLWWRKLKNKFLILSLQQFEIIQESVKSSTPLKFESQMSLPIVNFRKVINFLRKFSTILFQNYGDSDRFWQKRNWAFADLMTPDGSFNFDAKVKSFFIFHIFL